MPNTPNVRVTTRSVLAACALLLTAVAAAFPTHPESALSLDLTPLYRISTQPTPQAGTYASAAPHGSHRHQSQSHHHTL